MWTKTDMLEEQSQVLWQDALTDTSGRATRVGGQLGRAFLMGRTFWEEKWEKGNWEVVT